MELMIEKKLDSTVAFVLELEIPFGYRSGSAPFARYLYVLAAGLCAVFVLWLLVGSALRRAMSYLG